MLRFALAALVLPLVGCDSSGPDVDALDDVLLVDLVEGGSAVRLETEGTPGCFVPIVYETRVQPALMTVRVEGLAVQSGPVCRAITTSQIRVALPQGEAGRLTLRIEHRGQADVYAVRSRGDGPALDPVRQSVTRLRDVGAAPDGG
jgi:hypothetical protein